MMTDIQSADCEIFVSPNQPVRRVSSLYIANDGTRFNIPDWEDDWDASAKVRDDYLRKVSDEVVQRELRYVMLCRSSWIGEDLIIDFLKPAQAELVSRGTVRSLMSLITRADCQKPIVVEPNLGHYQLFLGGQTGGLYRITREAERK
jgi:hypothetical protein